MRRICLALPTNRSCLPAIGALHDEAAHAAAHFDVEVHLLVLDSCGTAEFEQHAAAVRALPATPGVVHHHLGEAQQRDFLRRAIAVSGVAKPEHVLDLMLPSALSYGACTNRAFLLAAALGCESVHRRDSDSRYQVVAGEPGQDAWTVFPIHHELLSLGRPAKDAAAVTRTDLDPRHAGKTVSMVGSSFVGEMSVDIEEMFRIDPEVYYEVVGLWAPFDWSAQDKREFADESFRGAGTEPFTRDHSTLTLVDPMRVDMCNIAFHGVHEAVPLMPATDTIGSDYFLIHLVRDATLPGVLHNRNIENFYTAERRTGPGFTAYQLRFAKFFLSMLYLNFVYDRMERAGGELLDGGDRVRTAAIADLLWESSRLDQAENVQRLDVLDRCYRALGGRYAEFADVLAECRERLLDEARRDIEEFAVLTEAWPALVGGARATDPYPPQRQRD
ncbi:hypothetical protein SAMN05216223_103463 [Actinacidiphila yanglinensis]|uniref:Uncharacterized protein n=1 Tax=Actinacidiphila yanglinensis TaxID=310779 RepID=A0A1H5XXZ2_9ACTN|nr:DUF6271 family protein [Actinacidiphila yanglinensis]SEG16405.1 hypothetical protein SAMN05216223_103463 [Actinacidiphila yanglinensis]